MIRSILAVLTLACGLAGCIAELGGLDQGLTSALTHTGDDVQQPTDTDVTSDQATEITGSVSGAGKYQIFDLGPGAIGDNWIIGPRSDSYSAGPFILALFDDQYNLMMRAVVSRQATLRHLARHVTPHVYLGVTPSSTSSGGAFNLHVEWQSGLTPPGVARQIVYLNFEPASAVHVHGRPAMALSGFDAASVSADYAGETEAMATEITQTMRLDYADYNLTILSSRETSAPLDTAYSTIYFGGSDEALLGLADNVDMYNSDAEQVAIVYVESFSPYSLMGLNAEEMALMIGNVGSHELGHLLGLYHTQDPEELMDSTGSAWDLAQDQAFQCAPLETSVFPTGMQNAPQLLFETLGQDSSTTKLSAKKLSAAKILERARMRVFTRNEISRRCGLCLNPDELGGE